MRRPVKPKSWWDDGADLYADEPRTMIVEEVERDDWSGLYDANGNKLMRPRQAIGFRVRQD